MNYAEKAIAKMRPPSEMKIICVDVTNKCDLACSNCTRLLENQEANWDMSPENFRLALRSLSDYPGVIAMIGGNPCMHPQFEALCRIFAEEIPEKSRRGLWTNNFFKHQEIAREIFGTFNLNSHGNKRGIKSLSPFKDISWYHEGHSEHSPLLTAIRDFFPEDVMWEKISQCDINQNWSATIIQINGRLRCYFCEVAASFDLARGEDHGFEVAAGWWKRSIGDFSEQIRHFCPTCGVPAKFAGVADHEEIDMYSESNRNIALKSLGKKRKIIEIKTMEQLNVSSHKVTDYSRFLQLMNWPKLKRLKEKFRHKLIDILKGWR